MPPPRAVANDVSESEKPVALALMCEAPNRASAKGVNFPTGTRDSRPENHSVHFCINVESGNAGNILRAVEAAEICDEPYPGKYLPFQRSVPAVEVGPSVGRKICAAVGISGEDVTASGDLGKGRGRHQKKNQSNDGFHC
jgi:hypothetical protein